MYYCTVTAVPEMTDQHLCSNITLAIYLINFLSLNWKTKEDLDLFDLASGMKRGKIRLIAVTQML